MANRLIIILFFWTNLAAAQDMSRAEYISKYKDLAVAEMHQYGIPASITLAQGVLEVKQEIVSWLESLKTTLVLNAVVGRVKKYIMMMTKHKSVFENIQQ